MIIFLYEIQLGCNSVAAWRTSIWCFDKELLGTVSEWEYSKLASKRSHECHQRKMKDNFRITIHSFRKLDFLPFFFSFVCNRNRNGEKLDKWIYIHCQKIRNGIILEYNKSILFKTITNHFLKQIIFLNEKLNIVRIFYLLKISP